MSRTMKLGGALAALLVLAVFLAGFFHEASKTAASPNPVPFSAGWRGDRNLADAGDKEESMQAKPGLRVAAAPKASPGLLALASAPGYKRAAEMSLRVADCTKAEDELETRLVAIRGEILDMLMEGTEGSRTCSLSVLIPSGSFREFIAELRKMGKIQSERITASKLKPGAPTEGPDNPDVRELSLVAIRMADEKVAKEVLEGQGVLAASFNRSASHFLKGLAVVVEGLGYVLPFLLAFMALGVPFVLGARLRRLRAARISG